MIDIRKKLFLLPAFLLAILFTVEISGGTVRDDLSFDVTYGSIFEIIANDAGLSEFTRKARVYITGGGLGQRKMKLKVKLRAACSCSPVLNVARCQFLKKITAGEYDLYFQESRKHSPVALGKVNVSGPSEVELSPAVGSPGTTMTLSGIFFGSKKFKIWLTYETSKAGRTRKKRVKIEKPFKYRDAKGREA